MLRLADLWAMAPGGWQFSRKSGTRSLFFAIVAIMSCEEVGDFSKRSGPITGEWTS
jgi:hypothetical protein